MTKGVKICLAAAIILFVGAVIAALIVSRPADGSRVVITRDGEVLYELDLAEDREIRIKYEDGGYNTVQISGGEISIIDADCPDKTCVKTGVLRSADIPIVCLPHHLVIRFKEETGS